MTQSIVLSGGEYFHSDIAFIEAAAQSCLSFVRDGKNLSRWLVDKPTVMECGQNLYKLSDPELGFVEIDGRDDKCIYFHVGDDPNHLQNRIMITVHEGPTFEGSNIKAYGPTCLLYMIAWRMADMSDQRWNELCQIHEKEIKILKQILDQTS